MALFICIVELYEAEQDTGYLVLNREMENFGFKKIILANDGTEHNLPTGVFSVLLPDEWTETAVRPHVTFAAARTGLSFSILVVKFEAAAWEFRPRRTLQSPMTVDADGQKLLDTIEKVMDKVKPLSTEGAKIAGSFAQELIKSCITLNAGSLVAFPAFYKAILPNAVIPNSYYYTCGSFAVGTLLSASGMLVAFILLHRSFRRTTSALLLPMLRLQQQLRPDSMDDLQRNRLKEAEANARTAESGAVRAVRIFSFICGFSIFALVAGGLFAAYAVSTALHPPV